MKHIRSLTVMLLAVPLLVLLSVATSNAVGSYTQLQTITIPGDLARGFDISWVDSVSQTFYVADRTTGSVDVIDADTSKYLYSIKGFVGVGPSGKAGPDGILTIGNDELWAGDGNSTVKVVDLTKGASATVVATIDTGGTKRADELAYDPLDHVILIANDRDDIPFVSFISQTSRTILAQLPYPQTTGGIEQPVWDPIAQKFYLSIPSTIANPNGEVDELSATTFKITRVFPTTCSGPAGLALLPGERLMTSCGTVLDARSGSVLANVNNPDGTPVSADEIWYNPGDDRVYFGSSNVAVVDASTYDLVRMSGRAVYLGLSSGTIDTNPYQVLTYLFSYPIPMTPPAGATFGGHTLAANSSNNHIFAPVTGVGVKVFVKN